MPKAKSMLWTAGIAFAVVMVYNVARKRFNMLP